MTYLQLVNDVLIRLRETQVSTVTETSYSIHDSICIDCPTSNSFF
jgi:hypothetical protein